MNSKSGFTLVEVVVALAVIGILLSISRPQLTSYYQQLQLQGVVNQLVGDLHLARRKSAAENKKWGIIFHPAANQYLLVQGRKQPKIKKRVKLAESVEYKKLTFPLNSRGRPEVFFKQLGNLDTRNGRVVLKLGPWETEIVFSSNAGELNVR